MTKTYILNSLSKTFLVLALVNSCALFSVSAAKKKAEKVELAAPAVQAHAEDMTRVVTPNATYATTLVSTLPPSTGALPAYLNPKVDNGKLVAGGTILTNNICPWKIGQVPNPATGAYKPLQKGTKVTNADNYFPDLNGTTTFCANVTILGDLTVTGTLSSSSGQFCLPSDVALKPDNALLTNNIDPVRIVGGACVADDRLCAFTQFSGGVDITGHRFLTIPDVTLTDTPLDILGLQFASNIYDCPTSSPVAVRIHFLGYGTNCYDECFSVAFTEEVAVSPDPYTGNTSICILSEPVNCLSNTECNSDVVLTAQRTGDLYDQNPDIFLQLATSTAVTYVGDVFLEIIYSNNLTGITCLPNVG